MTKTEYEKKIAELEAQIEEIKNTKIEENPLKPPHPRWKPKSGDIYYSTCCAEDSCYWDGDSYDEDFYSLGIVFKTKAEAEFDAERLKVLAEINEWAGHNYDGAYIYYHRPSDEIMINWDGNSTYCFGDIRFKCVDDAQNCIKAVGEDRIKKYYFMVPEDNSNV